VRRLKLPWLGFAVYAFVCRLRFLLFKEGGGVTGSQLVKSGTCVLVV
jgi:hypothetical protein